MKKRTLFCLLAALLPLNVVSQTPQFSLRTSTEVVLVNVTVRDKNEKFIKDLKAQDFTILEDGKKQDIISIDAENTDSVVTPEAPTPNVQLLGNLNSTRAAAPQRDAPVDEAALKDRRLIVLFFDLTSMQ